MNESTRVYEWLQSTLSGDVALSLLVGSRIYRLKAPKLQDEPFIVYHMVHGADLLGLGGIRILTDMPVVVKAVGKANRFSDLQSIADRIDQVLHQAVGSGGAAPGLAILACTRDSVVDYGEEDSGIDYHHIGGQYSLLVQPL